MSGSLLVKLGTPTTNRGMNDAFNRELGHERESDRRKLDQSVQTYSC